MKAYQNKSNGQELEQRVAELLLQLQSGFPTAVKVFPQAELLLQNGQMVRPDFDLRVTLPHETGYYLIECQNRKRSSNELLSKIQLVRAKSSRKTFIFIHAQAISDEHRKALEGEGVMVYSFDEFQARFVAYLTITLAATAHLPRAEEQPRPHAVEPAWIRRVQELIGEISKAGEHAVSSLTRYQLADMLRQFPIEPDDNFGGPKAR
jgi:hypothetical protein